MMNNVSMAQYELVRSIFFFFESFIIAGSKYSVSKYLVHIVKYNISLFI